MTQPSPFRTHSISGLSDVWNCWGEGDSISTFCSFGVTFDLE